MRYPLIYFRCISRRRAVRVIVFGAMLFGAVPAGAADQAPEPASVVAAQNLERALLAYQENAADAAVVNKAQDLLYDANTPVLGNPHGDVAVVEFFDYQCSYCKAAEPKLEKLIKGDPGVRLVIKEFPILGPVSLIASKAALASARQGKYEAYHQAMMAYRGQLKVENIFEIAKEVHLDLDRLRKDMDAPEIADQIISNLNLARALKISMTPGLIVGTHVYSGLSSMTESGKLNLEKAVADARSKKG